MKPVTRRFIKALVGLQDFITLEDPTLEQLRLLQKEVEPTLPLGKDLAEYRTELIRRQKEIAKKKRLDENPPVTLLWCRYEVVRAGEDDILTTTVEGMLSYRIRKGTRPLRARVSDLILRPLRGDPEDQELYQHMVVASLMRECKKRLEQERVELIDPLPETESGRRLREAFRNTRFREAVNVESP